MRNQQNGSASARRMRCCEVCDTRPAETRTWTVCDTRRNAYTVTWCVRCGWWTYWRTIAQSDELTLIIDLGWYAPQEGARVPHGVIPQKPPTRQRIREQLRQMADDDPPGRSGMSP